MSVLKDHCDTSNSAKHKADRRNKSKNISIGISLKFISVVDQSVRRIKLLSREEPKITLANLKSIQRNAKLKEIIVFQNEIRTTFLTLKCPHTYRF